MAVIARSRLGSMLISAPFVCLDERVHIYWKHLEEDGWYFPCMPGKEYKLMGKF